MGKENEKRQGKGIVLMILGILISVLAFIWYAITSFHTEGNFFESSRLDKDLQGISFLVTDAMAAYSKSQEYDASEVYVIEFTEDGFEIYGKNNGRNAKGISKLKNEFNDYANGQYESISLAGIREEALSVRFSKLDTMVITIDESHKFVSVRCSFKGKKFEDIYYETEMNKQ
ncbi:MAG: hypothetical protein K6F51_06380 [Acetatifactor sp.]|nr:hypothetical protein [Acetatifactor sp.]